MPPSPRPLLRAALDALGVRRLVRALRSRGRRFAAAHRAQLAGLDASSARPPA